jgi:hypothetical protein
MFGGMPDAPEFNQIIAAAFLIRLLRGSARVSRRTDGAPSIRKWPITRKMKRGYEVWFCRLLEGIYVARAERMRLFLSTPGAEQAPCLRILDNI